jgi:hypothetical protein
MPSPSWSTLLDFLDQPAVAIRVAERDETVVVGPPGIEARGLSFRSEVKRLAHVHSAIDELSPRSLDVRRDRVHSLICSRLHPRDSRGDLSRAFRSRTLVLFTQGLGIRFAVGIEEFLSALLPRRFEFGRRDVPVRPAFLGNGS